MSRMRASSRLQLALLADLRDEEVAGVAAALCVVERARDLEREAVALPVAEAPLRAMRRSRSRAPRAPWPRTRSGCRTRSRGSRSRRGRARPARCGTRGGRGGRARRPGCGPRPTRLRSRTSTSTGESVSRSSAAPRGVDLLDLALDLLEQLAIARHCFTKYSDLRAASSKGFTSTHCRVSSRVRARLLVGVAAAAAAALVIGVTVLQAGDEPSPEQAANETERPPPLELGLVVRDDPEARALREAEEVLDDRRARGGPRVLRRAARRQSRLRRSRGRRGDRLLARRDGGAFGGARLRAARQRRRPPSSRLRAPGERGHRGRDARAARSGASRAGLAVRGARRRHPPSELCPWPPAVRRPAAGAAGARKT